MRFLLHFVPCMILLIQLVFAPKSAVKYEKITYLAVEHAAISYFNRKYASYVHSSARRYSRNDPIYYYNVNITSLVWVGNNISVDYYFYEWLTNVYKRSFVEMHFRGCDLVNKNNFFGVAIKNAAANKGHTTCPFPPGEYVLENMTVPFTSIPRSFPFRKGRIECNLTWIETGELVGSAYVDMELRQMKRRVPN